MNLTPSSGKALKGLAVGSLALAISGAAMIPASFAAPNNAHQTASPSASAPSTASLSRVVDTSASVAQITQGLPGQYQVAYSKANHKIWMVGNSNLASTIARVNADTLQIEEVAALPFELDKNGEFGYISAYGITVDDVSGTVWVTNTTDNSLSVFDQNTMEQIWTNHGIAESDPNWIEHPRSVLVDHNSGKVFVTGRYYVSAIDMKTFEVTKLQLEGAPNGGTRYVGMNMTVDGDKLYVPERTGGKVFVINTHTFKTEQVIQTRGENSSVEVRPSDVTIDHSENEIYVSSQGVNGVNSGISVYDLTTGEFKKFVKFGTQALSMENDEGRDLVYVTDFGTGKIAIFDAKTDRVIGEVEMNGGKANDLTIAEDGSVIAVDKQDVANTTAAVPYVLNAKTGDGSLTDTYTSKATVDRNGKAVPSSQQKLVPNSIVKFYAEVSEGEFTSTATINPAKVPFQGYPKQATAVLIDPTLNFAEGTVDITRPYTFHVSGYDYDKPPAEGLRLFLVKEGEWSMGYDKLTDSELANIQKVSTIVPASAFVYNARTGKYSFEATLRVPANTMQYSQGYMLGTVTAGSDVATNRNYDSAVSLIVNDAKDAGNADNRDEADEPAFPAAASASPSASAPAVAEKPAAEQSKDEPSKTEEANDQLGTTTKTAPLKNSSSAKSESQPKSSGSDSQVNASATKSAPQSKGSLAKTGAQSVLSLAAVGAFALIAGAAVMVLRRRKA